MVCLGSLEAPPLLGEMERRREERRGEERGERSEERGERRGLGIGDLGLRDWGIMLGVTKPPFRGFSIHQPLFSFRSGRSENMKTGAGAWKILEKGVW